jgi:hypothetical protein
MDFLKRTSILKTFEVDCYSICFYILQCEKLAMEAATKVMLELYLHETFYLQDPEAKKITLKNTSIKQALELYKCHLNRMSV